MSRLKIKQKMLSLLAVVLLALLAIGAVGYNTMSSMNSTAISNYQNSLLPIKWLESIRSNINANSADLLQMILSKDAKTIQSLNQNITNRTDEDNTLIKQYIATKPDASAIETLNKFQSALGNYRVARQKVISLIQAGKNQEVLDDYLAHVDALSKQVTTFSSDLSTHAEQTASSVNQQNEQVFNHTKVTSFIIFVVAIGLTVFLVLYISRTIEKPVKAIQDLMKRAEEGDLTVQGENKSRDEIGQLTQSFNTMMQGIQRLILQIRDSSIALAATSEELSASAEQTGKAAEQITVTTQEVASNSDTQVRSVEDTLRNVEQISASVQQIDASSQEVLGRAIQTSETSADGNQAIQQTIQQMNLIHAKVDQAAQTVRELGEQTQHIGEIVKLITEISAQTNLLALNAAIEAARAGEHGRGFAVVADEVRKLAEESSNSAKRIADFVISIQNKVTSVVKSMEEGTKEVDTGIEVVNEAGISFGKIQDSVHEVSAQIKEVTTSVEHLSGGVDQIVNAISVISKTSEESAAGTQTISAATEEQLASMEEITATSNSLAQMAEELQQLIAQFRV